MGNRNVGERLVRFNLVRVPQDFKVHHIVHNDLKTLTFLEICKCCTQLTSKSVEDLFVLSQLRVHPTIGL